MKHPRLAAAGVAVALVALVANTAGSTPDTAKVATVAAPVSATTHAFDSGAFSYRVTAGDVAWSIIVTKICGAGGFDSGASGRFQQAALPGSSVPVLNIGDEIPVNPANCRASASSSTSTSTIPPTTTIAPTTSTSITLAPTTTSSSTTTTMAGPTTTVPPPSAFLPTLPTPFIVTAPLPNQATQGEGNFRTTCGFSHLNYDDAIVAPGVPGAAHLHMYSGNTLANANSTYESLRTTGRGTCDGDTTNRSAYWAPAVIDGTGQVLVPDWWAVYYKAPRFPEKTVAMPFGLKMIAGYDMAGAANQPRHHTWSCDGEPDAAKTAGTHNCPATTAYPNGLLIAEVIFPECWDGIHLDTDPSMVKNDHRSHLAYATSLGCPATHPVQLPQVSYKIAWGNARQAGSWKLSSDTMPGMVHDNGTTLHADWMNGWAPDAMQALTTNCLVGKKDCQDGNLGDGRKLRGYGFNSAQRYGSYTGPLAITAPARA